MFRVFAELTWWSVRNRLRARLRRLREPRYLVGALAGAAWFGSIVLRPLFVKARPGRPVSSPLQLLMTSPDTARFGVALALLGMALLIAWWPGRRRALEFSPAEEQFLFPAPIARRQLLHYKLLRSQGGMLFGAVIAAVLLRPATLRDGWMFSVGFWLALTVGRLYSIGIGLGAGALRRRWMLVAASLAAAAVLAVAAAPVAGQLVAMTTVGERIEALRRVWSSGVPRVVLWPFLTLARLPLAGSTAAFWVALPGVLLLVVATYAWVLRTDSAYEGAAATRPEKPAAPRGLTPRVGRGGRGAPFPLALEGRPETAILWKNLILLGRYASARTLLRLLPFFAVVALTMGRGKNVTGAATLLAVSLTVAFMVVLLGPGIVRNDLRQDLRRLAVLKSWPVSGAALVRGELLAPALVLSVAAWLSVLVGALVLGSFGERGRFLKLVLPHRGAYAGAALLIAPALILAQLVVQNGFAVLLPAWMATGRSRGIEGTGQGMLVVWGGLLAAAAYLAPPALIALLVMSALSTVNRAGAVVGAAAVLLAFVVAQSLLVTGWLGRVLERSDLTAIDPVE